MQGAYSHNTHYSHSEFRDPSLYPILPAGSILNTHVMTGFIHYRQMVNITSFYCYTEAELCVPSTSRPVTTLSLRGWQSDQ